jgi:hypothetical protein
MCDIVLEFLAGSNIEKVGIRSTKQAGQLLGYRKKADALRSAHRQSSATHGDFFMKSIHLIAP